MRAAWWLSLVALVAVGCDSGASDGPPTEAPPEEVEAEPEVPFTGWACADLASCFGYTVGRARVFERRVGERREEERWTLTERLPEGSDVVLHQEGGPARYVIHPESFSMTLRGELVEVLRFPVQVGDTHEVTAKSGARVHMKVRALDASVTTPAGSFSNCLVHEARFAHAERPESSGLKVETTFCEGIGEVSQRIELSGVTPHPIEFTLVNLEQS